MDETEFRRTLASSGLSPEQAAIKAKAFNELTEALLGGHEPGGGLHYFFVPGRIEFLGKHTDYAGGRSLIAAIERGFCIAAAERADAKVRITDAYRSERIEFDLTQELIPTVGHWSNYPLTVASRLVKNFPGAHKGADIIFTSDLPPAAGLSSSSALVVAIFSVLSRVNTIDQRDEYKDNIKSLEDLAGYLGAVENGRTFGSLSGSTGVGTLGGSQDHTAILCCRPGHLSQYSFSPVRYEDSIPVPDDIVFAIAVSGVSADKTGSALEKYNRVSLMASEVLSIWRSATGRDDPTLMAATTSSADAPQAIRDKLVASGGITFSVDALLKRYEQFLRESTEIIPGVAGALVSGDMERVGELVDRSQDGAERMLGNQIPETIALAKSARGLGAIAASAFGAGFGGSVWALVKRPGAETFVSKWSEEYSSMFPDSATKAEFFLTCAGPSIIEPAAD